MFRMAAGPPGDGGASAAAAAHRGFGGELKRVPEALRGPYLEEAAEREAAVGPCSGSQQAVGVLWASSEQAVGMQW